MKAKSQVTHMHTVKQCAAIKQNAFFISVCRSVVSITACLLVQNVANDVCAQRNLGEPFVFENEAGRTMPYRMFTPPGFEDAGSELPLVVFLHGSGERGRDNTAQVRNHINGLIEATQSDEFASFLVAPQLPAGASWNANGRTDLGIDIIRSLTETLPIDEQRIYVTGLSLVPRITIDDPCRFSFA